MGSATQTTTGSESHTGRGISIADNHRHGTLDCAGGPASIAGNGNDLVLTHCAAVSVSGNGNHVTAMLAGNAAIDVAGNHNVVRYSRARGPGSMSVSNTGNDNTVDGH